jgi:hypothetical protein
VAAQLTAPARRAAGGFGASQWLVENLGPLISKTFTPGNAQKARARPPRRVRLSAAATKRDAPRCASDRVASA